MTMTSFPAAQHRSHLLVEDGGLRAKHASMVQARTEVGTGNAAGQSLPEQPSSSWASSKLRAVPTEPTGVSRESTVSIRVVKALVDVVEQAGVPAATFLAQAGFGPEQLQAPDARISRSKIYPLCELAMELTGDSALGLHWAETIGEGAFVPISHLIAHSATLRQGFEALAQFNRLLSDQASYQFVELEDTVTVRGMHLPGASLPVQRFCSEMMVTGFFRLLRNASLHARPSRVCFEYPAPPSQAEYLRVFGDTVCFDQPFTGIVFDRALMDMPALHKDVDVHDALQALAERRLMRITQRTPYALRVRELLMQQTCPLRVDMGTIARLLGLSVRSLRRRLAEEGKPYNEVAEEALALVAQHFLRDQQRSIQETAYEMGFSDTSTFHRAFKRWTGTTPNASRSANAP